MGMFTDAVVKVGDGRGFIVDREGGRLIVTAAHCLPQLPACHPARNLGDCTYLVGALDAEPTIYAECLFAEAIADLAILGTPEDQALAYEKFVMACASVFTIGPTRHLEPLLMLSLEGEWVPYDPSAIRPGMSGSPVVTMGSRAISVISLSGDMDYLNPSLPHDLPLWWDDGTERSRN